MHLDYPLLVALLTLVFGVVSAYFQYRQVRLMTAQVGTPSVIPRPWRRYWPLGVIFVLMVLAWIPYFMQGDEFDLSKRLIWSWGVDRGPSGQAKQLFYVTVNGARVMRYGADYKLALVAIHRLGTTDDKDAALQKSNLYDIMDGGIQLVVDPDLRFLDAVAAAGRGRLHYVVLLVPNHVSMAQFSTLRQAYALGAKAVWQGGL